MEFKDFHNFESTNSPGKLFVSLFRGINNLKAKPWHNAKYYWNKC